MAVAVAALVELVINCQFATVLAGVSCTVLIKPDTSADGTIFMNRCDYLDPALAWTGVKDSGHGISLSSLGFSALTRVKSFHLRTEL